MNTRLPEVSRPVRSLAHDWRAFADCLAAALATLEDDQNLILAVEHRQLNSPNASAGLVRFSVHDGVIFAEADVAAEPIVAKHIDLALRRFCGATDGVDVMLQREFGGRTAFIESPSGALLH